MGTMVDSAMQTLSIGPLATVYEFDGQVTNEVKKEKEVITYSKGVQASIEWSPMKSRGAGAGSDTERDSSPTRSPQSKRLSRRQKEKDEEIRTQLRKEIEEELKVAQQAAQDGTIPSSSDENFPFKALSDEELTAVENSEDFIGFVERSTKVLERALDQQLDYDILADYALGGLNVDDEDEGYGSSGGKKGRRIKEIAQFWDERWSKKRMISDLDFSSKVQPPTPVEMMFLTKHSSPNSSSPRTPRIPLRRMIQMASSKYGICICTIAPSISSMRSQTSSQQSSRPSIPILSSAVHIRVKC
jgi:dynein intermediate chain